MNAYRYQAIIANKLDGSPGGSAGVGKMVVWARSDLPEPMSPVSPTGGERLNTDFTIQSAVRVMRRHVEPLKRWSSQ